MVTPTPVRLMRIKPVTATIQAFWPLDGSPYAGYPFRWDIDLNVMAQSHSSPTTMTPYVYDGRDIKVGDWISNAPGGFAWKIVGISRVTSSFMRCTVEDVDQYNTYSDTTATGNGAIPVNIDGFVFQIDDSGRPLLQGITHNVLTSNWQSDLQSRFFAPVDLTDTLDNIGSKIEQINTLSEQINTVKTVVDGPVSDNVTPGKLNVEVVQRNGSTKTLISASSRGNVGVGLSETLASNATMGFPYITSIAGPPTGTPEESVGDSVPMVWDRINHRLYIYQSGVWYGQQFTAIT